mgnify:CR=1 FL=1
MVKLTDLCPATARIAAVIIREVFDEKEVALFEGDVSVATALLDLPFNHIFFTGSPIKGATIRRTWFKRTIMPLILTIKAIWKKNNTLPHWQKSLR